MSAQINAIIGDKAATHTCFVGESFNRDRVDKNNRNR
jgi:hypothetical protein